MRGFLLFIGWSSVVGSVGDAALGLYALWHAAVGEAAWQISLDDFLRQFVYFIYWVKQVAYLVMPHGIVNWLFGLPALLYFPVRILMSVAIGWWALRKAEQLRPEPVADEPNQ